MSSPLHLGGRKKKVGKKRGRPMKESNKGIANAIQKNAPESLKVVQPLSLSRFLPPATNLSLTDFQCAICLHIVDRPVETPCRKLLCADCISESLWCQDDSTEQEMPCLCCKGSHYITSTSFTPASEVVLKVLGALLTRCDNSSCTAVVGLKHLKQHVESGCKITASTFSPSKLTIGQIISRPLQSPPTSVEQKAAANVVQRLMQTSPTTDASEGNTPSSVIKLTTEGTPMSLLRLKSTRLSSAQASRWTVRRRSNEIASVREVISGGAAAVQLQAELSILTDDDRRELLKPPITEISPEDSLAMKAGALLPWKKIRIMRRYMSAQGVKLASERKMRMLSKHMVGENLVAEEVPLSQPLKLGVDLMLAPLVYVPDLVSKIIQLLDQNDSTNRLTWHNGMIPEREVWVKVGGDKGADTVKIVFQLCNVINPNSVINTCVFCVFEGKDTTTNLHVALDRYKPDFEHLSAIRWRGKRIRIFMSGDYEFLSRMYGITGAQGRHPCLWCTITSNSLKVPREQRAMCIPRTLNSLQADFLSFETTGRGNIKVAKHYNNVISQYFFPIPINQVCPPGLHITLGIFYRLWCLLEAGCHKLDLELATRTSPTQTDRDAFQKYSALLKQLSNLSEKKADLTQFLSSLNSVLGDLAIQFPSSDSHPVVQALKGEVQSHAQTLDKLEREIQAMETTCSEGFPIHDGPFIRCLEKLLGEMHVHREAYYGGTFTGNNAHRCLKAVNVDKICAMIPEIAAERCPDMEDQAQGVANKYGKALLLFSKCHNAYDSSRHFNDSDLSTLVGDIDEFLAYYRSTFPESSFSPKLHMLEDHVVPFLRQWRVGLGVMGEQGAESIHARFNTLQRTYANMTSKVDRLKCMMMEHFRQVSPENISRQPPVKRRKSTLDVED